MEDPISMEDPSRIDESIDVPPIEDTEDSAAEVGDSVDYAEALNQRKSAIAEAMAGLEEFTSALKLKAYPAKEKRVEKVKVPKMTTIDSIDTTMAKIEEQENVLQQINANAGPRQPKPRKPGLPTPLASGRQPLASPSVSSECGTERSSKQKPSQASARVREMKKRLDETAAKDAQEREVDRILRQQEAEEQVKQFQQVTKGRIAEKQAQRRKSVVTEQKENSTDPADLEQRRRESARRVAARNKEQSERQREQMEEEAQSRRTAEERSQRKAEEFRRRTKQRLQERMDRLKQQQEAETEEERQRREEQAERARITEQEVQRAREIALRRVKETQNERNAVELKRKREAELEEEEQLNREKEMIAKYGTKGGGVRSRRRASVTLQKEELPPRVQEEPKAQKVQKVQKGQKGQPEASRPAKSRPLKRMSTQSSGSNASSPRVVFKVSDDVDQHHDVNVYSTSSHFEPRSTSWQDTIGIDDPQQEDDGSSRGFFPDISSRQSTPSVASAVSMSSKVYTYANLHSGTDPLGQSSSPTASNLDGEVSGQRESPAITQRVEKKAVWKQKPITTPSADFFLAQLKSGQQGNRRGSNSKS